MSADAMSITFLDDLVRAGTAQHPNKAMILGPDGGTHYTYADMDGSVDAFAAFLIGRGVEPGDRVMLATHNTPEFFVQLFGTIRRGAVAVPVDSTLADPELEKIIAHADPKVITVVADSVETMRRVGGSRLVVSSSLLPGAEVAATRATPFAGESRRKPSDLALLLYTSGTTGNPKGVMHTHATLLAKTTAIQRWFNFDNSYISLCLLPTHFGHGLICNCLSTFRYQGSLVLCHPFNLDLVTRLWDIVETLGVSTFSAVPTVVRLLLQTKRGDRSAGPLRFVTCASAPLRPEDARAFETSFGVPLLNCYGITETASWTAYSSAEPDRPLDSVGTAFGCEIRAVDNNGDPLPAGTEGELQVKGPSVMKGYYKNTELTEQVLQDGWFRTGDLGRVDAAGNVFLVSRLKEIIIRAGLNIYPDEVDAVMMTHDGVAEAYACGLPNDIVGEQVAALVARKPGAMLTGQDLIAHCKRHLAAYKCPERVAFVDEIPKTSRGKVNRARLQLEFT